MYLFLQMLLPMFGISCTLFSKVRAKSKYLHPIECVYNLKSIALVHGWRGVCFLHGSHSFCFSFEQNFTHIANGCMTMKLKKGEASRKNIPVPGTFCVSLLSVCIMYLAKSPLFVHNAPPIFAQGVESTQHP